MTSIFDCKEYTDRMWPVIQVTNARYGRPADTVIYFFAYTPTGRISRYWASFTMHYSLRDKPRRLKEYIRWQRYSFRGRRRGYRWSKAYLYSGNPEEWKDWKDESEENENDAKATA
jgi:hypothetical protein